MQSAFPQKSKISPPHRVLWIYDTKQYDGKVPILELLGMLEYLFIAITPKLTIIQSGRTY